MDLGRLAQPTRTYNKCSSQLAVNKVVAQASTAMTEDQDIRGSGGSSPWGECGGVPGGVLVPGHNGSGCPCSGGQDYG